MATLQFQVDAVRQAVTSSTTCTPATAVSLKSLLLPRDQNDPALPRHPPLAVKEKAPRAPPPSRPGTAASSRPGTATARRRAVASRDDGLQHDSSACLSDKEKAQLATHVVNAALKALAEAAKPAPEPSSHTPHTPRHIEQFIGDGDVAGIPTAKPAARTGLRRSSSMPMTPLQPRTMNRVFTSPMKAAGKSATAATTTAANTRAACSATVECARVAFATLRSLHDSGSVLLPDTQLEAGLSSFVAKLIGMNMLDQASRELCILKRRLQRLASPHDVSSASSDATRLAPGRAKEATEMATKAMAKAPKSAKSTAAATASKPISTSSTASTVAPSATLAQETLDYGDVSAAAGPVLKLIVASQLQALRILVALKKPAHTEAALPFLRQSCASSPLNLLFQAATAPEINASEQQKISRQLETLAQLLLALTPSISSKEDASTLEPKLNIGPTAALEFQCLSLQVRLRSRTRTTNPVGNQTGVDADKDVLTPFSRCLSAYARRCRSAKQALSYSFCRNHFDIIHSLIRTTTSTSERTSKSPIANIYLTLSAIARETGRLDEAVHWATELAGLLDPGCDSAARCSSTSAHLLALQLRNATKQGISQDIQTRLAGVLEAIKGPLKGDTAELEELLGNVCLVRKVAVNLLVSQASNRALTPPNIRNDNDNHTVQHGMATHLSESTRMLLEAFVLQCPRFCLRWLGKPPAAKSSTKDFLRYEQRRQLLSQSIRHTLDSAFVVTKMTIEEGRLVWEQIDSVLGDSTTVLDYLGDLRSIDATASYYVKISHFYYLSYTTLRQRGAAGDSEREALRALRHSIDCVKQRPGPEKEKAQLILKLERLADLSKSAGQIGDALGALQAIRTSLVDDGALAQAAAALDAQPPSMAWTASEKVEALSRTLVSIHRLEQVHMDWTCGLDESEQAAVLEHQLHFIYLNGRAGSPKGTEEYRNLDLSHPCVEALLRIYYPTRFPIRRLRTLLCLFSANLDMSSDLADIMPQTSAVLGLIKTQGLADDTSLVSYLQHYRALAASLTAFSEGYPDAEVLQDCLSTWRSLVAANPTQQALERVVDNIVGLWTHLQSIAEYLKAMGRDTLVTAILELSSTIARVLSGPADDGHILGPQSHDSALALASHYIRLGDSSRAEKILHHLRSEIQQTPEFSDVAARFHLSFAEYLIATGRFEEACRHILKVNFTNDESVDVVHKRRGRNGSRRRLCAQACLLYSVVALEKGDFPVSLQNARNGVRMLFQDWNRLERSMRNVLAPSPAASSEDETLGTTTSEQSSADLGASLRETLSDGTSSFLSSDDSTDSVMATPKTAASPEFWALFHPLFDSMMRLSSVYAHLGLFQETVYYAEQAQKIAAATNASLSLAQVEGWQGTIWLKAGKLDKARVFASRVRSRLTGIEESNRKAILACELGSFYREAKDDAGERDMLQQAEGIIQQLSGSAASTAASEEEADLTPAARKAQTTAARKTRPAPDAVATRTTRATRATKPAPARGTATKATKPVKKASATAGSTASAATTATDSSSLLPAESAAASGLRAAVLSHKVMSCVNKKDWAAALTLLRSGSASTTKNGDTGTTAVPLMRSVADVLAERVALAACLLGYSTEQMAHDAVFSVLQDSTLSFPAVSGNSSHAGGSGVDLSCRGSGPKSPVAVKGRAGALVSGKVSKATAGFVEMLQEAQDCLIEAQSLAAISGDTGTLNRISSMLQSAVLVLSATSWSKPRALGHPAYASCSVELARNMTWRREWRAVLVEKVSFGKGDVALEGLWWPATLTTTATTAMVPVSTVTPCRVGDGLPGTPRRASFGSGLLSESTDPLSIRQFQRDYIDIVPKDWSVVSLALSENKHDLCITKLQAGHGPFVIRLPLERAISRDADNEVFNFQQGRTELLDIVKAINSSCHDARDMTAKGAKTAWWTEREMLDTRLKELLDNMEQIWLGGFRGIFSQHVRQPALFARFQKAFDTMLDKHLPSRQAPAGRGRRRAAAGKAAVKTSAAVQQRVSLDERVLDLFIGLGDATAEHCDFDEALDDLLYFVVDILQFHGEHNAYDEIDFDSMVVETSDALFAYHSGVRESQARDSSSGSGSGSLAGHLHTILVLDKSLHVFPWEAIPCMQELAVSRVPSLACLRRLIVEQQQSETDGLKGERGGDAAHRPSGHRASSTNGAYVLNPSGDLGATQATFEGRLATGVRGPAWTRIVGRAPTEEEFEAALSSKDVLLYFGHGSGAQYIRGRTVRKLERCRATALLMGCGSAMLDYNGEFELHGPVWNYMLAGCPAVVGTLWDVTDKDIDRFAGRAFEEWGLVARGSFAGEGAGGAKKQQQQQQQPRAQQASLVEAVVRARAAPRFRYITAAAVCVYGIPVYLS